MPVKAILLDLWTAPTFALSVYFFFRKLIWLIFCTCWVIKINLISPVLQTILILHNSWTRLHCRRLHPCCILFLWVYKRRSSTLRILKARVRSARKRLKAVERQMLTERRANGKVIASQHYRQGELFELAVDKYGTQRLRRFAAWQLGFIGSPRRKNYSRESELFEIRWILFPVIYKNESTFLNQKLILGKGPLEKRTSPILTCYDYPEMFSYMQISKNQSGFGKQKICGKLVLQIIINSPWQLLLVEMTVYI